MNKLAISFLTGAALSATLILLVFKIPFPPKYVAKSQNKTAHAQKNINFDRRAWDEQFSRLEGVVVNLNAIIKRLGQPAYISNRESIGSAPKMRVTTDNGSGAATSMVNDNQSIPAQPTPEQVNRYTSIKSRLYDAANNYSTDLTDLINKADELTPEQRQELTDEAMEMIKRGELRAEQFTGQPDS